MPGFLSRLLRRARARIEHAVGRLKRVVLRREETARNDRALVAFGSTMILVGSVRTA